MKNIFTLLMVCWQTIGFAQSAIEEKKFPLKEATTVALHLKFADHIRVVAWEKNEVAITAEININDGEKNQAHTMEIKEEAGRIQITTGYDEAMFKESTMEDCEGNRFSKIFNKSHQGYAICSQINYIVYLPSQTALEIETISGNIEIEHRTGPTEAKSISGFVDMSTSADQEVDLYLKSISGEVYSDLDITLLNHQKNPLVGYELKGQVNGGGNTLRLESISGDIFLRKRQ